MGCGVHGKFQCQRILRLAHKIVHKVLHEQSKGKPRALSSTRQQLHGLVDLFFYREPEEAKEMFGLQDKLVAGHRKQRRRR